MATNKRVSALGKEKAKSPSQTATKKLKPTPNQPTKPNVSTASHKQIPSNLRPPTRTSPTNVSKPLAKKPASVDTAHKPPNPRPKSIAKTLSPTQKARVSTTASPRPPSLSRSPSLSGKTVDSQKSVSGKSLNPQKPVPGKNLITSAKEVGKQRVQPVMSVSSVQKSCCTRTTKKEIGSGLPERKEQTTSIPHEKIEYPSTPSVLEAETEAQNIESPYIAEGEEKMQVDEKGNNDLVQEEHEPLDIEKSEAEDDQTDAKIATCESPTELELEDTPLDIKRHDSKDLEEQGVTETNRCNKGDSVVADESHHEDVVEEVEEAAKERETAMALGKKEEVECKETEGKEVENGSPKPVGNGSPKPVENGSPKPVGRGHVKRESAVSNDVIEETASKLREQRKNRVKALAGAFETVISLQEQ